MRNIPKDESCKEEYYNKIYNPLELKIQQKDIEKLLIFGEYIKRKFYTDCIYTIMESKYTFKYIKNQFNSKDKCFNYILNTFIKEGDRSNFQNKCHNNTKFIDSFAKYEYNIYEIIRNYFYNQLEILKKVISTPEDYYNPKFISKEELQFLKSIIGVVPIDYEVILYRIKPEQQLISYDVEYQNNSFSNFVRIINNAFKSYFDECFLLLYRNILDKYYLYMDYLFQIANIEDVINDNYHFNDWPHFLFIPETRNKELIKNYIDVIIDDLNNNIIIKIDLDHNLDSIYIANCVRETLINNLFFYKTSRGSICFQDETLYFINKFDSAEKHNKINFYSRVHGLYIWDQKFILNNKHSINNICTIFNRNFPNWIGKKDNESDNVVHLRRCYKGTLKSIKDLIFYQLK